MLWLLLACANDSCELLCTDISNEIGRCQKSWELEWVLLGANSKQQLKQQCIDQWNNERSELEPREIDIAEERCEAGSEELNVMDNSEKCDQLRALYMGN
jgi:hypothetical protein